MLLSINRSTHIGVIGDRSMAYVLGRGRRVDFRKAAHVTTIEAHGHMQVYVGSAMVPRGFSVPGTIVFSDICFWQYVTCHCISVAVASDLCFFAFGLHPAATPRTRNIFGKFPLSVQ